MSERLKLLEVEMAKKRGSVELPVRSTRKVGLNIGAACQVITDALAQANPGWQVTVTDISRLRVVPEYGRNRARIVGELQILLKCE
jgi:hypothetical protein